MLALLLFFFNSLFHVTCQEAGMIIWVHFFWGGAPPPLKLGREKTSKSWLRFDFGLLQNLIANIVGTDGDIQNRKAGKASD